jgi:rhodanese-related sulfurtransferase
MLSMFRKGSSPAALTVAEAVALAAKNEVTLLDVREVAEIKASGTAKGAIHIPLSLVPMKADPSAPDHDARLTVDRPVAVYCASGGRSGMAVQVLRRLGYDAHNIGGFGDWCTAGGTVQR